MKKNQKTFKVLFVLMTLIIYICGCKRSRDVSCDLSTEDVPDEIKESFVPKNASNIVLRYQKGDLFGFGERLELICKVEEEDLFNFANRKKYKLQKESIVKNFCESNLQDCSLISGLWEEFNPDPKGGSVWRNPKTKDVYFLIPNFNNTDGKPPEGYTEKVCQTSKAMPKDFWAYNCVASSMGGISVLYDIQTKMLYLYFSSN